MKKIIAGALMGVVSIGAFLLGTPTAFAGYVNGYYRSNGTYVNGYYRSDANAYKYDNYSFKGNWNDAYNTSYYAPTKSYSSSWYQPAWNTQSDYWYGKSSYDSLHSNSYSSYLSPYSSYSTYTSPYSSYYNSLYDFSY